MNKFKQLFLAATILAFSSSVAMAYVTPGDLNRLRGLAMTFTSAVVTTLTATTATITTGAVTTLTGVSAAFTGAVTDTRTPSADSATTNNGVSVAYTAPVDTTGTNTHNAFNITPTISNATGGTNTFNGYNFANYTGDAQVNVNGIKIGTSDGLGTAYAINIGSGWDLGFNTTSPVANTRTPSADGGTTDYASLISFTVPVDTTGTNTHYGVEIAPTVSNATGGTNTFSGFKFDAVTGDAQVNVNGLEIGTGTILGTSYGVKIGSGWDENIDATMAPAADSGATNKGIAVNLTAPVDTTGTNTHNGIDLGLTISNATGGTNKVNAVNIGNVTGDAQDDVTGLRIGTGTTLGTSNAIVIGSGWDAGLVTDSGVQINSTNGTAVTALRFAFDAVANGQTSKTVTVTGATSSSRCVAQANEVPTNAVYIKSAAPGTDQVVVTTSGDPGASNLDLTVVCFN